MIADDLEVTATKRLDGGAVVGRRGDVGAGGQDQRCPVIGQSQRPAELDVKHLASLRRCPKRCDRRGAADGDVLGTDRPQIGGGGAGDGAIVIAGPAHFQIQVACRVGIERCIIALGDHRAGACRATKIDVDLVAGIDRQSDVSSLGEEAV